MDESKPIYCNYRRKINHKKLRRDAYKPFAHGATRPIEQKVDDEAWPLASELLPEHTMDKFKLAQSAWHKITKEDDAKSTKYKVLHSGNLKHPRACIDEELHIAAAAAAAVGAGSGGAASSSGGPGSAGGGAASNSSGGPELGLRHRSPSD